MCTFLYYVGSLVSTVLVVGQSPNNINKYRTCISLTHVHCPILFAAVISPYYFSYAICVVSNEFNEFENRLQQRGVINYM